MYVCMYVCMYVVFIVYYLLSIAYGILCEWVGMGCGRGRGRGLNGLIIWMNGWMDERVYTE